MKSYAHNTALINTLAVSAGVALAVSLKLLLDYEEAEEQPDTTDELLRNPRNADPLLGAIDSLRRGEWESHPLATRPPVAA